MTIELFPDQEASIKKLRQSMRKNKRILLQGETGSGKSIMASYMIKNATSKGHKAAFIVPRRELLRQMSETFDYFNIRHSFVAAGKPYNPYSNAYLCTTGTLVNRLNEFNPTIIFCDETHHGSEQLDKINQYFTNKNAWIIGLTATPDNPNLSKWYDDLVCGPTVSDLIALKRLSNFRYFAPSAPDLSGIKTIAGEYAKSQLNEYMMEKRVLVGDAVKHYKDIMNGLLNMTFCTSINHSLMTADTFRQAGIEAVHMDGDTPEHERAKIARDFALRKIKVLCTVDLCLFGYDLSSASGIKNVAVECMSDLRPTKSRNTQRQKIGRVLRFKEYPAIISDHAGNHNIHGLPNAHIEWSLEVTKKKKTGEKAPATKQCDNCFHVHTPAPICPECGNVYEIKGRELDEVDGVLSEVNIEAAQPIPFKQAIGGLRTLDELIDFGKSRQMKYPAKWAAKVMSARMRKNVV